MSPHFYRLVNFSIPFLLWKKSSSAPVTQWRQLVSCDWSCHSQGKFDLKINRSMEYRYSGFACSYVSDPGLVSLNSENFLGAKRFQNCYIYIFRNWHFWHVPEDRKKKIDSFLLVYTFMVWDNWKNINGHDDFPCFCLESFLRTKTHSSIQVIWWRNSEDWDEKF